MLAAGDECVATKIRRTPWYGIQPKVAHATGVHMAKLVSQDLAFGKPFRPYPRQDEVGIGSTPKLVCEVEFPNGPRKADRASGGVYLRCAKRQAWPIDMCAGTNSTPQEGLRLGAAAHAGEAAPSQRVPGTTMVQGINQSKVPSASI